MHHRSLYGEQSKSLVLYLSVLIFVMIKFKVFRYSFFGTIPNFLNRLLDSPFLVRSK